MNSSRQVFRSSARLTRSVIFVTFGLFAILCFAERAAAQVTPLLSRQVNSTTLISWTARTLPAMSLEQKVSQMFAAEAAGNFMSPGDPEYARLVDLVERFEIGGLIFFQGRPLAQAALANDLQSRSRLPLLIAQDMEWGPGMRIRNATTLPRAMAIGATGNRDYAYAAGLLTGKEARALGIHQIYAPVADVNSNPENPIINIRSFGEDPVDVSRMVAAFVHGIEDGGAIATVKHFPGHGDTATDSHADLPMLPFSRKRLDRLELVPFRAAVDAGAGGVMTGHLSFPLLEPDRRVPATLSRQITEGLLRTELGFDGIVVTDAMNMAGVTKHFGVGEAAVRAVIAGADIILMTGDVDEARQAIVEAVDAGRISEQRINESVVRLLRAKHRLGLDTSPEVDVASAPRAVATAGHMMTAEVIGRSSITLLRNESGALPLSLDTESLLVVSVTHDNDKRAGRSFVRTLQHNMPKTTLITAAVGDDPPGRDVAKIVAAAHRSDAIIVPVFITVKPASESISLPREQARFIDKLIQTGRPVIVVSFGNPYITSSLRRQPPVFVGAYGDDALTQRLTAEALLGLAPISGRLPVTVPGTYARGDGLDLAQKHPHKGEPEEAGVDGRKLAAIDSLLLAAIADSAFPGAAVAVGRPGVVALLRGYGHFAYQSGMKINERSLFDLASLTKVVATTTAAMKLYEDGRLDLSAPVARYLPAFAREDKAPIKIEHLLRHTSGFPSYHAYHRDGLRSRQEVIAAITEEEILSAPGTVTRYSDLGMIVMGFVIESITGESLATFCKREIYTPLGMLNTGFRPVDRGRDSTVVPTEIDIPFRNRLIQGEVHDELAYIMGGVAGHAGLFSTAEDLARFADMYLNEGRVGNKQFLRRETISLFTTKPADGSRESRPLGWDFKTIHGYSSAGTHFGALSFGHTGFTGTSLWIDPEAKIYVILLTNRVYPTRDNRKHVAVRPAVADAAYKAIVGPAEPIMPRLPDPTGRRRNNH